ncbi:hypothetical protein [Thioclava sp. IC9]|uniref:hypothetical protein n=1 Tax=Thioclava sp. IC9 TaxID=1973007 RepID=UPI001F0A8202|nr:hypothetical protein [Thioclava sp. IC9]
MTGCTVLAEARAIIPKSGRLPGVDGKAKMSKSGDNAIALCASPGKIRSAVRAMFTDPSDLRVEDAPRCLALKLLQGVAPVITAASWQSLLACVAS